MKLFGKKKSTTSLKLGTFCLMGVFALMSCESDDENVISTGAAAPVTLQFKTVVNDAAPQTASLAATNGLSIEKETLEITGVNGAKLNISEISFIVDDFELEKADGECEGLDGVKEDACEEFELGLSFVHLPLKSGVVELTTAQINKGAYTELEFGIDNLDLDDEEDATEKEAAEKLLSEIRTDYSNWPEKASMIIRGTFVDVDGKETPFATYAEAEVSIEMRLDPALEIKGEAPKALTVSIKPADWFTLSDGTLLNLSTYDYASTNKILEFETEIENGFKSTEIDDD